MELALRVLCIGVLCSVIAGAEFEVERQMLVSFLSKAHHRANTYTPVYRHDSLPDLESSLRSLAANALWNSSDEIPFRNVSAQCTEDMVEFMGDFLERERYALQMVSANGGIAKDFMVTGSCQDVGIYDQCLSVVDTPTASHFDARYCLVGIEQDSEDPDEEVTYANSSELLFFRFGFCVPDSCWDEDVVEIVGEMLKESRYTWNVESSCTQDRPTEVGTIIFFSLIGLMVILATLSTAYDMVTKATVNKIENKRKSQEKGVQLQPPPGWRKALLVNFSVLHNGNKLTEGGEPDFLRIIGSLRVFALQWSMLSALLLDCAINDRETLYANPTGFWERSGSKLSFQPVWNNFAADIITVTFGASQAYATLKEYKRHGRIHWLPYFGRHYWFLTMPLVFNLLGVIYLTKYVQGPYWQTFYIAGRQACDDYWWTHLIYMNNLIPFPEIVRNRCLSWAWLLGIEVKMFVVNVPFIFLLRKSWKKAAYYMAAVTVICSCVSAALATYFGHNASGSEGPYNNNYVKHFGSMENDILFDKVWHWWPCYLMAILVGYLIYQHEQRKFKLRWYYTAIGWTLSTFTAVSLVYGLWPSYLGREMPQWESVFYITYKHTAFCAAVCWVIFACLTGHGGIFTKYLLWKHWAPWGRSAYTCYLWHKPLVAWYMYSLNKLYFYTTYSFIYLFLSTYVFISLIAFIVSLVIDTPILGLWLIIEQELYKYRHKRTLRKKKVEERHKEL